MFQADKGNPIIIALCAQILEKRAKETKGGSFKGTTAAVPVSTRGYPSPELSFPRGDVANPINLVSVNGNNEERVLNFEQNPNHSLKTIVFESERGFHEVFNKMLDNHQPRPHMGKEQIPYFEFPKTFEGVLTYRTHLGEWNAFPTSLLPFIKEFSFETSDIRLSWPNTESPQSIYRTSEKAEVRIRKGNEDTQKRLIKGLVRDGLITAKKVQESGRGLSRTTNQFLLKDPNNVYQVIRQLEDHVRRYNNDSHFWDDKVKLEFQGEFPYDHLYKIFPDVFDRRIARACLKSDLFTIQRYSREFATRDTNTEIYVHGDLETAARIGASLTKDETVYAKNTKEPGLASERNKPLLAISKR